jgi:glycosyltransferase involved in cell wall biosynthesis
MCGQLVESHDFTLSVVGDGARLREAQQICENSVLAHRVIFHGWLGRSDLLELYDAADIFVLPSWAEGMPNAMIEAMAARTAIVVTRVGCVADIIAHNINGKLVEARNTNELLLAVKDLITDPKLRTKLAANAFETASKEFGLDNAVATLTEQVKSVIGSNPMNNGR